MDSKPTGVESALLATLRDAVEPLWITGLALLIVFVGSRFGLQGEKLDWTEYLLLGTVFPIALLGITFAFRLRPFNGLRITKTALAAFAILMTAYFIISHRSYLVVVPALIQWLLMGYFSKSNLSPEEDSDTSRTRRFVLTATLLFVIAAGWLVASRYIWWNTARNWITSSGYTSFVFALTLLLVVASLYDSKQNGDARERRFELWSGGNVVGLLILAMVCVRTDHIFGLGEIHHWSFYVGPAQVVRQGGWLLWDVPSQYGFLSSLTLAWLPFKTAWQSLFVVNALFNFLIATFIFLLFRSLRSGFPNLCFSLGLALAAVFFHSGLSPDYFVGPTTHPNVGGLRFFWCYVLLALLLWQYRKSRDGKPYRKILLYGCAAWLIGVLWSIESAIYCSIIWLPAYALLVWRSVSDQGLETRSFFSDIRKALPWLSLPIVLFSAVVGLITAIYLFGLGHAPDWNGFIEYAVSYVSGFSARAIETDGSVWILFLVFCAAGTAVVYFLKRKADQAALPLIFGAWGCLWATISYFISISHANNVHNLGPILCIVIGLMLYLFSEKKQLEWWGSLLKATFVPLLVIVITATFGMKDNLKNYITAPKGGYAAVDQLIPLVDPGLDQLLATAGVKAADPIIYVPQDKRLVFSAYSVKEGGQTVRLTAPRVWLPASPVYSLAPLSAERRQLYMSRFANRNAMSGWLIEFKMEHELFPWFYDFLRSHYTRGRVFENQTWRLTWYDFKR